MKVDAAVAAPRPGRRGAAQRRSRRNQRPAVRGRPPLSRRRRASDGRPAAGRETRARAAGKPARRRASTPSTPRPRRWPCSKRRARRSPTSSCRWTRARPGIRAGRRRWAWARTVLAAFGELHPRVAKALDAPAGTVAAEIYLDAIPAPRTSERARPAFAPPALQAVTRDFAFVVPADLAADALVRAIRGADKAADHRRAAVRPL